MTEKHIQSIARGGFEMDWVKIEYDHYGRKEYRICIRCMNREDMESYYDRYECISSDKDTTISNLINGSGGFPIYLRPANDPWLRARLFSAEFVLDKSVHTIVKEVPMNEVCKELA